MLLMAASLHAATISGELGVGGTYVATFGPGDTSLDNVIGMSLDDTVAGTLGPVGLVANKASGDFLPPRITPLSFGTAGTISIDSFVPVVDFLVMGGFHLDIITLDPVEYNATSDILHLAGTGLLTHDDFDSTQAKWEINAEADNNYSMTVAAVPVPAAVWLFGTGLIGLVGIARRKA